MIPTTELIKTVVEDLHYIKDEWGQNIDDAHLRRGSTTLRRLLVDGELQRAWKAAGFAKEPIIPTATLSFIKQFPENQILLACAGGGRFGGNEARQIHVLRARPEKPLEGDPIDELLPLRSFVDSPCMVIQEWHVPRRTV